MTTHKKMFTCDCDIRIIHGCLEQNIPGILNKSGVTGMRLENYPSDFASLLNNQVGTIQLTSEAVVKESKHIAYQALLADPVVDNAIKAEQLLNTMIDFQKEYLGYLK